jgi:hypothetical protein
MDMITNMLETLDEYHCQADVLRLAYEETRRALIPPDVQAALADLEAEHADQAAAVSAKIAAMEAEIKAAVARLGQTVKGAHLQAVYSRPRISWDGRKLEGFALAHPEILAARTEGAPSVSIRRLG